MAQLQSPKHLRLSDVRRIFRLIGEIREIGAEPTRWRPHLLRGLREIVGADLAVSSELHFRTTAAPGVLKVVDVGWVMDSDSPEPLQIRTEREEKPESYWVVMGKEQPVTADEIVPIAPAVPLRGGSSFILSQ